MIRAVRPITIGGTTFQPGQQVTGLDDRKAAQLIALRMLADVQPPITYRVLRRVTIAGRRYQRGDRLASRLSEGKLAQLLDQRYLEPLLH